MHLQLERRVSGLRQGQSFGRFAQCTNISAPHGGQVGYDLYLPGSGRSEQLRAEAEISRWVTPRTSKGSRRCPQDAEKVGNRL